MCLEGDGFSGYTKTLHLVKGLFRSLTIRNHHGDMP